MYYYFKDIENSQSLCRKWKYHSPCTLRKLKESLARNRLRETFKRRTCHSCKVQRSSSGLVKSARAPRKRNPVAVATNTHSVYFSLQVPRESFKISRHECSRGMRVHVFSVFSRFGLHVLYLYAPSRAVTPRSRKISHTRKEIKKTVHARTIPKRITSRRDLRCCKM